MKVRSIIFLIVALLLATNIGVGQDVFGVWQSYDKSGQPRSHIKLYEKDGKLFGRIVKIMSGTTPEICRGCPGEKNGKVTLDIDIIWDMEKHGDIWKDGKIINPEGGKIYGCKIWLQSANKLKIRGFLGSPIIGRTQVWDRAE